MANINRDFLIVVDVKKSNVTLNSNIAFNILDENTQNIFINLVINNSDNPLIQRFSNIENAEDYRVIMNILKPTNEMLSLEAKLHDKDLALFEIQLPVEAVNSIGNYSVEILTKCTVNDRQEVTTSNALSYSVVRSIFTGIDDSEIVESETYPLVMELFDKLHDIDRYEEDRRQAEIIRQLNEENRIADYEQLKQEIRDDVFTEIDALKVELTTKTDELIEEFERLDVELTNTAEELTNAENTLEDRLDVLIGGVEVKENQLDNLVSNISGKFEGLLDNMEAEVAKIENRYNNSELGSFLNRLETTEEVNRIQDRRLDNAEAINRNQEVSIACLFANSQDQMVSIDVEGNSVQLANSKNGYALVNEIQGRTMVNLNKDVDKELVLTEAIALEGQEVVTDKGVDGAKVDVFLEGNTMVNLANQEESVPLTKGYTVENGNHIAFQGDYDGKAKPHIHGNTMVNLKDPATPNFSKSDENTYNITTATNHIKITGTNLAQSGYRYISMGKVDSYRFKPSTVYTICFSKLKGVSQVCLKTSDSKYFLSNRRDITPEQTTYTLTTVGTIDHTQNYVLHLQMDNTLTDLDVEIENPILLEGDYTNKPIPSYFEGLQSSFEDQLYPVKHQKYTDVALSDGTVQRLLFDNRDNVVDTTKGITVYNPNNIHWTITYGNASTLTNSRGAESSDAIIYIKPNIGEYLRSVWSSALNDNSYQNSCIVVEGDLRSYDFANFKQQYKVDYVSTGGTNLVDESKLISGYLIDQTDKLIQTTTCNVTDYIRVSNGETFTIPTGFGSASRGVNFYNMDKTLVSTRAYTETLGTPVTFTSPVDGYMRVNLWNDGYSMQINRGTTLLPYEPIKKSIKTLYLNSPLLEGDSIEVQGNNIVHVHRYESFIVPTTGDWILGGTSNDVKIELYSASVGGTNIHNKAKLDSNNRCTNAIADKLLYNNGTASYVADYLSFGSSGISISLSISKATSLSSGLQWLRDNPVQIVFELATPTYEVIATNDDLYVDSYVGGHLDFDTAVPIEKVMFEPYYLRLSYLKSSTSYVVQFEADGVGKADIMLGDWLEEKNIAKGINRFTLTSASNDNPYLGFRGIGCNISNIVVTEAINGEFGYFKGLQSVGEGGFEVRSGNKNLFDKDNSPMEFTGGNGGNYQTYVESTSEYIKLKMGTYGMGIHFTTNITKLSKGTYTVSADVYCGDIDDDRVSMGCKVIVDGKLVSVSNTFRLGITGEWKRASYTFTLDEDTDIAGLIVQGGGSASNYTDMDFRFKNVQLEKGSQSTDYTPHQSQTQQLTHEPLRAVGDVKDKYVLIDGEWYIERNCIQKRVTSTSENWVKSEGAPYYYFFVNKDYALDGNKINVVCNEFKPVTTAQANDSAFFMTERNHISVGTWGGNGSIAISPAENKVSADTLEAFLNYLDSTPIDMVVPLLTPQYEKISYNPLSVYSDTTYISTNSTIPCNLKVKNHGFNAMIKPSTTYTIASNLGVQTIITGTDTDSLRLVGTGTIKDVRLFEGTVTDIPDNFRGIESTFEQNSNYLTNWITSGHIKRIELKGLKPNTTYTVYNKQIGGTYQMGVYDTGGAVPLTQGGYTTKQVQTFNTGIYTDVKIYIRNVGSDNSAINDWGSFNVDKTIFLEGNYSNYDFETDVDNVIKYKVEIKTTSKNLLLLNNFTETYPTGTNMGLQTYIAKIKLKKHTDYTLSGNFGKHLGVFVLDKDLGDNARHNTIYTYWNSDKDKCKILYGAGTFNSSECEWFYITTSSGTLTEDVTITHSNIQLEEGSVATAYEPYQSSTISFYLDEPLRSVGEVADRVFLENGKVKVERKIGSKVFNGSETWAVAYQYDIINYAVFYTPETDIPNKSTYDTILCNNFHHVPYVWDTVHKGEGLSISTAIENIYFKIHKGKALTVEEFKQWLSKNPTMLVYQLAEPTIKTIDTTALRLQVFEGGYLSFDSNIPTSSKIEYTIDVPVLNEVAEVSSITDEQDMFLVEMATQLAVMNLTL